MALDEGKALHPTGRYYPRGIAVASPADPGRAVFPRGQDGAFEGIGSLPSPLYYYALEIDGSSGLTDEMGALDLDSYSGLSGATNGKSDYCARQAGATPGLAWRAAAASPAAVAVANALISCWVNRLTVNASVYLAGGYSGSEAVAVVAQTEGWSVHALSLSDPTIPVSGDFYHVLCYYRDGSWRRIVNAGTEETVTGALPQTMLLVPYIYLAGNNGQAAVDELAFFDLGEEVTHLHAEAYAAALYNAGAGQFYRDGSGWVTP